MEKAKRLLFLYLLGVEIPEVYKFCIFKLLEFCDFDTEVYKPRVTTHTNTMSKNFKIDSLYTEYFNKFGDLIFYTLQIKKTVLNTGVLCKNVMCEILENHLLIKGEIVIDDDIFLNDLIKVILHKKGVVVDNINHEVFDEERYEGKG